MDINWTLLILDFERSTLGWRRFHFDLFSPFQLPQITIFITNKVFTAFQSARHLEEDNGIIEKKRITVMSKVVNFLLLGLNELFNYWNWKKNGVPKNRQNLTERKYS